MENILQGTTPTLTIAIDPTDFLVSDIVALELAVKQKNNVTTYSLTDVTLDPVENTVSKTFTQDETLKFKPDVLVSVQLRFYFADGNVCGTNRMNFNVIDLIGSEVLSP